MLIEPVLGVTSVPVQADPWLERHRASCGRDRTTIALREASGKRCASASIVAWVGCQRYCAEQMTSLMLARTQMGLSLAFHIVFAAFGVGLPLLLVLADLRAKRSGLEGDRLLATRMAKGTAILFAIGAVSGTVLSMELGLLWPELMRRFGEVIGPLFALEGFAFFTEAIFLGIYLYGRDRVSPRLHFASGCIVAVSGAASAAFVTVVNAFMNEPIAVELDGDRAFLHTPLSVLASPSAPTQVLHVLLSSYAVTAFTMMGVHAWLWLRGRERPFHERALSLVFPVVIATGLLLPLSGDLSAKHVAHHQTWKLGAMEALYETRACAPLHLGGVPDDATRTVSYSLHIPCGLSLLASEDPQAVVSGLDKVPRHEWPDVTRTHFAFQVMVGAGTTMALSAIGLLAYRLRKKRFPTTPLSMKALLGVSPLAIVALEAGWLVTEWGRQPYVVRGMLTTAEAATTRGDLGLRFVLFASVYLVLAIAVVVLLRHLFVAPVEGTPASPPTSNEGEVGA
jgi:cytochrome d ubiquinol oxidase subunit I